MHEFFDRKPERVAKEVRGRMFTVGKHTCTIMSALPRNRFDNEKWLKSKPLFGPDSVSFYASRFRGGCLLFLATAPGSCIRIEEVSCKGELITGAGRVAKVLGITTEATGDVTFDGRQISIQLHDPPRLKK